MTKTIQVCLRGAVRALTMLFFAWTASASNLPLYMVIDLSAGETAESYPVTYLDEPPGGGFNVDAYKTTKLALRRIDPGTFMMCGQYQMTLTKPYYMGVFEVTQKQYELIMGSNPSKYTGDKRPVEQVSYEMIRGRFIGEGWPSSLLVEGFMAVLHARTRLDFDLPTEAQWEYACRAGTTSSFNNGGNSENDLKKLGRYSGDTSDGKGSFSQHTTVGSYLPNAWGLYDMHGNVREWCLDWLGNLNGVLTDPRGASSGENRIIRGGAWNFGSDSCKSGNRGNSDPSTPRTDFGFRLSLSPAYVINFSANGGDGTMPSLMEFALGADIALPENAFTRNGWHFAGWATSPDGPVEYSDCSTVAGGFSANYGETVTLYARWAEETYTIHFDANGGTGTMADQTIGVGLTTTLDRGTFTKANCLMLGWATRPDGQPAIQDGGTVKAIARSDETVTLYAVWHEITGDGNGLSVKYYDIGSSGYSAWLPSETSMRRYFTPLSPTIATNTLDWGDTLQSGFQRNSRAAATYAEFPGLWLDVVNTNRYHGNYAVHSQDYFAMYFNGYIKVDVEGEYAVGAAGDDRIAVFIDDDRVCASHGWGLPSKGVVSLPVGLHRISIATYEFTESQGMFVSWKKPGDTEFSPLPQSVLYHDVPISYTIWEGNISILAESDLVEGVPIRLGGAPDGWTLHYTTDGSEPTAASPVYTEPFTLAESATVKVVAVNEDLGWTTDVAEQRFDLAPPLSVTGLRARQRYPWNGLVDIDFTLGGDTSKFYRVSAVATDRGGGTNLAVRTVWEVGGGITNSAIDVSPGSHRFVWDAAADLPAGFVADRVAVSLRAESINDTALYMIVDLSGGPDAERYPVSYLPDVPEGGWTDEYKTDKLVLRRVEPGWFMMGSPDDEEGRFPENEFLHAVSLSKPLMAAVFETTQRQFEQVQGTNGATFLGSTRPVEAPLSLVRGLGEEYNWPSIRDTAPDSFIGRLSRRSMMPTIDLPTDAQWEYVCRASTFSAFNNGGEGAAAYARLGRFGGTSNDAGEGYVPVGGYEPNSWDIYDMHGNVYEQCLDWFEQTATCAENPVGPATGVYRVVRGGSWFSSYQRGRAAFRAGLVRSEDTTHHDVGFRLFLHDAPAVVEAPIVAPQNLAATSDRADDVSLSWQPVSGAYAYQIRRSKKDAFEDGTWLNTVTNTIYADWTAVPSTNYTYWVRAQFESGKVGRWSEAAGGKRAR